MGGEALEGYVSRNEAAVMLGVSPETLTRWGTMRTGPASVKVGRRRLYRREAIFEWLRERETPAPGVRQ